MNNNCLFVYLVLMARVFIEKEIIVGYLMQKSLVGEYKQKSLVGYQGLLMNIVEYLTGYLENITPDKSHTF